MFNFKEEISDDSSHSSSSSFDDNIPLYSLLDPELR